jgi:polygalacturonase
MGRCHLPEEVRATENVTISDCYVTGLYQLGALHDGSLRRFSRASHDNGGQPTGRIKCGTESLGGFKNIAISNCVFEGCRGLAIECVDGGIAEDITVVGVTMRDIRNAPVFLRLGARLRGPPGQPIGVLRRVIISNVICDAPANDMPVIISGIPDHPVEDVLMNDIRLLKKGGGTAALGAVTPPEEVRRYPEPSLLGVLSAQGLFIRHARKLAFTNVDIQSTAADARPCCWLEVVDEADFLHLSPPEKHAAAAFFLKAVHRFRILESSRIPDTSLDFVEYRKI